MKRRAFLAAMGGIGLAGCAGTGPESTPAAETVIVTETRIVTPESTPTDSPTPTPSLTASPEPAEFVLDGWNLPERVEINEQFKIRVSIKNVGGQTGTYRDTMRSRVGGGEWSEGGAWVGRNIGLSESIELESDGFISYPYMEKLEFKLDSFSKIGSVQVVNKTSQYGEIYTNPDDIEMTAVGVSLQESYTYEDYAGRDATEQAAEGKQWAFVDFYSKNIGGTPEWTPLSDEISIISGSSQYDYQFINKEEGRFEGGEIQPGIERRGWIAYEIPDSLSIGDLTVVWSYSYFDGDVAAYWSQSGE